MAEKKSKAKEAERILASAAFVGVLLVIGIPLWWKTTEVYRVALPYSEIYALEPLSEYVSSELVILGYDQTTVDQLADAVNKSFADIDVIKLKITKSVLSIPLQQTLKTVAEESEAVEEIASVYDVATPNKFYVVQRQPLAKDVWLGGERVMFFRDDKAIPTAIEALKQWVYQTSILVGARSDTADQARRVRFTPAGTYSILLSVVHPKPHKMEVDFDARSNMEEYIGTFVDELSLLHNFTLKSQWLHLVDFDFQAREIYDETPFGRVFSIRRHRLQQLLTTMEERSASRVSPEPTISLVLYVVPCDKSPVVISDEDDLNPAPHQALMSPRWGGVVLDCPTLEECTAAKRVHRPNANQIMAAFVTQLRPLLGIVDLPSIPKGDLEPLRSVVPRRWELDSVMRIRTLEHLTSAERTLQSLAELLGEISNIVIDDVVGQSIKRSVAYITAGSRLAKAGDLTAAVDTSRQALIEADAAFTAPRLLALLYFPDDQKYAVYIPLFLPVLFPVLMSTRNIYRWLRGVTADAKEKTE